MTQKQKCQMPLVLVGVLVSDSNADGETFVFVVGIVSIVMGNCRVSRYIEVRVGIVNDAHALARIKCGIYPSTDFVGAARAVDFNTSDVLVASCPSPSSCIPALPNCISGSDTTSQSSTSVLVFGSVSDCWPCRAEKALRSVSSKNTKFASASKAKVRTSARQCSLLNQLENPNCVMYIQIVGTRVSLPFVLIFENVVFRQFKKRSCIMELYNEVIEWSYRMEL